MLTEQPPLMPNADAGASGGTPAPAAMDGADAAVKDALDAPPEWAPQKYWDPKTKSVKTEDLGKAYINLEKLLGREKVPVPTSDDDEEGWARWYAASGRPEKPDAYEFKRPDKLPEGLNYDEDTEKAFRDWAHINGLNKKQAANLYDTYVKTQIERHAAYETTQKQSRAQAEMALRREYGNQYDAKLTQAKMALRQFADPDYYAWLDQTGQGNNPQMIRVWARIGEQLGGETRLQGKPQAQANPADMDRAIGDFREKYKEALFSRDHPDHAMRVKEYNKLFEARYGE